MAVYAWKCCVMSDILFSKLSPGTYLLPYLFSTVLQCFKFLVSIFELYEVLIIKVNAKIRLLPTFHRDF